VLVHGERSKPFASVDWKNAFSIEQLSGAHDLYTKRIPCVVGA